MKVKRAMLILTMVMAVSVIAGSLPAPTGLIVTVGVDDVTLDWDDVTGATKYSVDIEGTVTFDYVDGTGTLIEGAELYIELSFGTSDRIDGGEMGDSYLIIAMGDLEQAGIMAIQDELALPPQNLIALSEFDGEAKVKALAPGKNKGKQNNPFSDPVGFTIN